MRKRLLNRPASYLLALSITAADILSCGSLVYAANSKVTVTEDEDSSYSIYVPADFTNENSKEGYSFSYSQDDKTAVVYVEDDSAVQDSTDKKSNQSSKTSSSNTNSKEKTSAKTDSLLSEEESFEELQEIEEELIEDESDMLETVLVNLKDTVDFEEILGEAKYFAAVGKSGIAFKHADTGVGNIATARLAIEESGENFEFGDKGTIVIGSLVNSLDVGNDESDPKDGGVELDGYIGINNENQVVYTTRQVSKQVRYSPEEPDTYKYDSDGNAVELKKFVDSDCNQNDICIYVAGLVDDAGSNLSKVIDGAQKLYKVAKWSADDGKFVVKATDLEQEEGTIVLDMSDYSGAADPDDASDPDAGPLAYSRADWGNGKLLIDMEPSQNIIFVNNDVCDEEEPITADAVEVHIAGVSQEEKEEISNHVIWYYPYAQKIILNDSIENSAAAYYGTYVCPNAEFSCDNKDFAGEEDTPLVDSNLRILADTIIDNTAASLSEAEDIAQAPANDWNWNISAKHTLDDETVDDYNIIFDYLTKANEDYYYSENKQIAYDVNFVDSDSSTVANADEIINKDGSIEFNKGLGTYYIKMAACDYDKKAINLDKSEYIFKITVAAKEEEPSQDAPDEETLIPLSKYVKTAGFDAAIECYKGATGFAVSDISADNLVSECIFKHTSKNLIPSGNDLPGPDDEVTVIFAPTQQKGDSPTPTTKPSMTPTPKPTVTPTVTPTPTKKPTPTPTRTTSSSSSSSSSLSVSRSSSYSDNDYDFDYDRTAKSSDNKNNTTKKKSTPVPTKKAPDAVGIKGVNSSLSDYDSAIAAGAKNQQRKSDNSPIKIYFEEEKAGNRVVVSMQQMQELKEQKSKRSEKLVKAGNYTSAPYQGASADIKEIARKVSSAVIPETPVGAAIFWIIPVAVLVLLLIRARMRWQGAILGQSDKGLVVKKTNDSEDNSLQHYINVSQGVGESLEELRERLKKSHATTYVPLGMKMKIVLITPAKATTIAICSANEEKMYSILSEYEDRECKVKVIFFKNERENCAELDFVFGNRKWNKDTIFETKPLTLDFNAI